VLPPWCTRQGRTGYHRSWMKTTWYVCPRPCHLGNWPSYQIFECKLKCFTCPTKSDIKGEVTSLTLAWSNTRKLQSISPTPALFINIRRGGIVVSSQACTQTIKLHQIKFVIFQVPLCPKLLWHPLQRPQQWLLQWVQPGVNLIKLFCHNFSPFNVLHYDFDCGHADSGIDKKVL